MSSLKSRINPTKDQLQCVKQKWNLEGEIKLIRRVENFVYAAKLEDQPVILRLTEPHHRSKSELESELDWMHYLSHSGLKIANPIFSNAQSLVESIEGKQIFYASVFSKAQGAPLEKKEDFSLEILHTWGKYIAHSHVLTQKYQPKPHIKKRTDWNQDTSIKIALQRLDKNDLISQRCCELTDWLQSLPTHSQCFGLVHCDLHHGNFFIHEGEITAFDFDDCAYHWFSYDLAVPLLNLQMMADENFFDIAYEKLFDAYIGGYSETLSLDKIWIERLDLFVKFRVSILYHWIKVNMENNTFDRNALDWCHKMISWGQKKLQPKLHLF